MAETQRRLSNIERYNLSLTQEERRARTQKAGRASGRARRKYRDMRETLQQLMERDIDDVEEAGTLKELGLDSNVANAVGLSVVRRAIKGEVTAVKFLRDTLDEKTEGEGDVPVRAMDLSRLTDRELAALADREVEA